MEASRHTRRRSCSCCSPSLWNFGSKSSVHSQVINGRTLKISFTWPTILLDSQKLINSILSFCSDMNIAHGTLLAQILMYFLDNNQDIEGDNVISTCSIPLPHNLKSDFAEDLLTFESSEVCLYLIRFSAPECNFVIKSLRWRVFKFKDVVKPGSHTADSMTYRDSTVTE